MSDITSISPADLRAIEHNLGSIFSRLERLDTRIEMVDSAIDTVDSNVRILYSELESLANDFHEFVDKQIKANRLGQAETRLVKIRQEIEKKFGHYDVVRRTTTGILQADDLGIVKKTTISSVTEEMMITTPGYWLAPCLVALASWISDNQEIAERALREGIKRDDEKTSLFFGLICRRAERKQTSLRWIQRYLANQDEEKLDRKAVIIIDAYASGLLGSDSEGVVSKQLNEWLERLSNKPGFVEQQTKQWSDAINLRRKKINTDSYVYLRKYSKTWSALEDVLEGAYLHEQIFNYFISIFNKKASVGTLKEQLDDILDSLVTDFDDEEIPLRKEEKLEQFVVKFKGDEQRAQKSMDIEKTAFEATKDFTQLLTDAAMKPESSHASVSTQKFAIALSKEWISNAYNDVVAQNRMKIPHEIEINVDTFNSKTTDGQNENEILTDFQMLINSEKSSMLETAVLSTFDKFCFYGGIAVVVVGVITLIAIIGIVFLVIGIGMIIHHFSRKKSIEEYRKRIEEEYEEKRAAGYEIIRAVLAEVVDYRMEFEEKDSESQKVTDFLEQISPDQYVRKLVDSNRKIKL